MLPAQGGGDHTLSLRAFRLHCCTGLETPEPFNLSAPHDAAQSQAPFSSIFIIRCELKAHDPLLQVFTSRRFRYVPLIMVRRRSGGMIDFKGSHFEKDIILWGVRWYVAYPISYRQLEEMMCTRC